MAFYCLSACSALPPPGSVTSSSLMHRLLNAVLIAVTIAAVVAKVFPDDNSCSLNERDGGQLEGHRSLIHRHSVHDLSQPSRGSSSHVDLVMASHRKSLDEFALQVNGTKDSTADVHSAMKYLQLYLDHLGYTEKKLEGHTDEFEPSLAVQTSTYDEWAQNWNLKTVCETGFNAGHSALRFLAQTWAHVYEFDLCDHNYTEPAGTYLNTMYFGRLTLTCGDSRKTVPDFHKANPDLKCDLIIIDGGHDLDIAEKDLDSLAKMASENAGVAIDDTPCTSGFCSGPNTAWANFVSAGCIQNDTRVPMGPTGVERGFSYGRLKKDCARLRPSKHSVSNEPPPWELQR